QALLAMLRAGEARNRECRKSDARPERPEDRPGQDAEIARRNRERSERGQPQRDECRGNHEYAFQAQPVHEPRGSPSADEEEDRRSRKKREARAQWRVAKDLLQVDGQHDERSGRGAHDQREDVAVRVVRRRTKARGMRGAFERYSMAKKTANVSADRL